jgi:stage IV sporulation protein FB
MDVNEEHFDSLAGAEDTSILSTGEHVPIPHVPKFTKREETTNAWLRSIVSLAVYLILGYTIFHSLPMLLLITAIIVFHELGHFFAMKFFKYKDLGIFFIPLLGAYVSGSKREVSQKESAVILLAGPLPGIIVGIICYLLSDRYPLFSIEGISLYQTSFLFIILNLINLLPVYPLDGGQLLNRVFLDEDSKLSTVFVFLSAALMCWLAWKLKFWVLLVFPFMMLIRMRTDSRYNSVEKRLEEENINADIAYEDLPDEDYWKIRNILIQQHPSFRDIPLAPPYEYHEKEEKIMTAIQGLLHRHLIQDASWLIKSLVIIVWAGAFIAPALLKMYDMILSRLNFG